MERGGKAGWYGAGIAAGAALALHVASLGIWFHSDDFQLLRAVRDGGPFGVWSGRGAGFFRPMASASIWLDQQIWHLNSFGYHFTNVLLAMLAAALVALVTGQIAPKAAAWVPGAAGVVFALMPAHAEAVEWVSCRGDLLAAVFGLGAISFALRDRMWIAAALVALAFTAKESALMIPVFLALLAATSEDRKRWQPVIATFGAAVAMVAVRALVLGQWVGGYGGSIGPASIAPNVGLYLAKAVLPTSIQEATLSPSLGPLTLAVLGNMRLVALVFVAVVLVALITFRSRMKGPGARLAGVLFLGFFVLALPALPLGMSRYTWEGSRFVYFPSVALAMLIALALGGLKRPFAIGLGFVLGLGYLWGDLHALQAWRTAGDRTKSALANLAPARGKLLLLSLPDSYRGAYILRNGAMDGLDLLYPGAHPEVLGLTTYMSESEDDAPKLEADRITVNPGPLPLQRVGITDEQTSAFGISNVRFGPYAVGFGLSGPVPRALLTPERLVPIP